MTILYDPVVIINAQYLLVKAITSAVIVLEK